MLLLLSTQAFAQVAPPKYGRPARHPVPTVPAAVGTQERTVFLDANKKHCAVLAERDHNYWYVYLDRDGIISQPFHTRADAAQWALHYCPVGK